MKRERRQDVSMRMGPGGDYGWALGVVGGAGVGCVGCGLELLGVGFVD